MPRWVGSWVGQCPSTRILLFALAVTTGGCQSLADLQVDYVECFDPPFPYEELFDKEGERPIRESLLERCWRIEDATVGGDDSDIKLEAKSKDAPAASWQDDPPRMLRGVEGNFVVVTQAEVARGAGDFCELTEGKDTAGILVRSTGEDATSLAALTLEPWYEDDATRGDDCMDEAENPPLAQAHALAQDGEFEQAQTFGEDGAGEIALCRQGSNLYFFYHDRADGNWLSIQGADSSDDFSDIGDDPVDVGLVTTVSKNGVDEGVQGTFNWVVVDAGQDAVSECRSALEEFVLPEEL